MHCHWEDEKAWERTGQPPSYAETKKMKPLPVYNHGCPRDSFRDCSSSSSLCIYRLLSQRRIHWGFEPGNTHKYTQGFSELYASVRRTGTFFQVKKNILMYIIND